MKIYTDNRVPEWIKMMNPATDQTIVDYNDGSIHPRCVYDLQGDTRSLVSAPLTGKCPVKFELSIKGRQCHLLNANIIYRGHSIR